MLPRQGRLIQSPTLRSRNTAAISLMNYSFYNKSASLFNSLPYDIRNMNCNMNTVKHCLDKFLKKVPDQPRLLSYAQYSRSTSNSLCDQIAFLNND